MGRNHQLLREKVLESVASVLPITAIVLVISITIAPLNAGTLVLFLFGAVLVVFGMGLFTMGADMAMTPMGEGIGVQLSHAKKIVVPLLVCLVLGIIVTLAEPDLSVLAEQMPAVPNRVMTITVAVGVGVFLVFAELRMLLKVPLSFCLTGFYILVFILAYIAPNTFIAAAFDSGGVTTGPITVPFIMAMGVGMASIRSDKNSTTDSFGLVAMCSIGPILSVLLLGIFYQPDSVSYSSSALVEITTTKQAALAFWEALPEYGREVAVALIPILAVFLLFQVLFRRFHRWQLVRAVAGFVYTYVGLVLFLTGVNVGFMPVGQLLGENLGASESSWLLVPLGMLIGYFIVKAEPAVGVLTRQVEEITNGSITRQSIQTSLSIGIACAVGFSMVRILTGISILWFLIPGYIISVVMTFFVPQIFTGIAFDSGGVASGPMTSTFLLPLAIGACSAVGGNVMTDAFGIVALVAMMPLVTIQVLGLVDKLRLRKTLRRQIPASEVEDIIIFFGEA